MLSGPDVPITEQLKNFRSVLGQKSDPTFALIQYQESDGLARFVRFRSEKEHAAHEKLRTEELAKAKKAGEESLKAKSDSQKQNFEKRLEEHKKTVGELSAAALANPTREGAANQPQRPEPRPQFRQQQQQKPSAPVKGAEKPADTTKQTEKPADAAS
jgi:hypothetical protein